MKILLAPSKSQDPRPISVDLPKRVLMDESFSREVMTQLKALDPSQLALAMHLSPKLTQETYQLFQAYGPRKSLRTPALWHYTGVVYDQLTPDAYDQHQLTYIDQYLRIFSAQYGLVHPFTPIWEYRLDFTMTLDLALKAHWKPLIQHALQREELILDLSSQEFSSLLDPKHLNLHRVEFVQRNGDQLVILSTPAKQARGALAHQLILHGVTDVEGMRHLKVLDYQVDESRSHEKLTVFIR
jgi:cytoplasmic iron level regulating protein YaaA (DUF328/UPF0246 family)